MKITCAKESLLEGINIVQKAVSTRSSVPILEGILLTAGDRFKMTGYDMEMGIEAYVDAEIKKPGCIVINSKMFGEIVRKLSGDVTIEVKSNLKIEITSGACSFEIKGLLAEQYPAFPEIEESANFEIEQKVLKNMIKRTSFAVSVDQARQILTGVCIECKDGELTFAAIDGFRMALRKNNIDFKEQIKAVVPAKTLNDMSKILTDEGKINVSIEKSKIMFEMDNYKVISRLLEGEYLKYNSIIPKDFETTIKVNVKQILASLERASLICASENKKIPVNFDIGVDEIVITSQAETGSAKENVKAETAGNNMKICFNPKYLIDALNALKTPEDTEDTEVDIRFSSSIGPCTINPLEGNGYVYLVLPVKAN